MPPEHATTECQDQDKDGTLKGHNFMTLHYTSQDIIEHLDHPPYAKHYFFIDLGHPYFYTANSRLTLFADETRWAIVFEKSGYANRGRRVVLWVDYFGNCLENLTPLEGTDEFYNSKYFTLIDEAELLRIEASANMAMQKQGAASVYEANLDADDELLDFDEIVWKEIKEVKVKDRYVKIPDAKQGYQKWIPDILTRDYPTDVDFSDLSRYLAYEYEELCRATDEELRYCLPNDLPKIMVIDEWHHKNYSVSDNSANSSLNPISISGDSPSSYETYRLIAEVLETKDASRFKPTLSPNNHWLNWPYAGWSV